MSLTAYVRKRDFSRTKEPAGKKEKIGGKGRSFVIQKHDASRLHYDFRLEIGGTLKSWAVPKGIPFHKGEKHLAVHVEDHPLEYAGFEGVIPKGQYGGGTVMIWDRGIWAPVIGDRLGDEEDVDRQLAKGEIKLMLLGKKLAGGWTLVRTSPRQWLLIKHRDKWVTTADPTLSHPRSVVSGRTMGAIARAAGASARQLSEASAADVSPKSDTAGSEPAAPKPRRRPRTP